MVVVTENSNPNILMMEPAKIGIDTIFADGLPRSEKRSVLVQLSECGFELQYVA